MHIRISLQIHIYTSLLTCGSARGLERSGNLRELVRFSSNFMASFLGVTLRARSALHLSHFFAIAIWTYSSQPKYTRRNGSHSFTITTGLYSTVASPRLAHWILLLGGNRIFVYEAVKF